MIVRIVRSMPLVYKMASSSIDILLEKKKKSFNKKFLSYLDSFLMSIMMKLDGPTANPIWQNKEKQKQKTSCADQTARSWWVY